MPGWCHVEKSTFKTGCSGPTLPAVCPSAASPHQLSRARTGAAAAQTKGAAGSLLACNIYRETYFETAG